MSLSSSLSYCIRVEQASLNAANRHIHIKDSDVARGRQEGADAPPPNCK